MKCALLRARYGRELAEHVDDEAHSAEEFAKFVDDKINGVCESTSSMPLHDVPVTAVTAESGG